MKFHFLKIPVIAVVLLCINFTACKQSGNFELPQLTGYWEIELVEFPNGQTKEYTISTTIDYFEMKGDSLGVQTKVQPQLDGTFIDSGDAESFKIIVKNDKTFIHFESEFSSHEQEIINLSSKTLTLLNEENIKYTYKRFEKFDFN